MQKSGKLELTWVGKYEEKKIEPRILVEDASKSYGDAMTENMLIRVYHSFAYNLLLSTSVPR